MKKYHAMLLLLSFLFLMCGACWFLSPGEVKLASEQMPPSFKLRGYNKVLFVYFEGPFLPDRDGTASQHHTYDPMWPNVIWRIYRTAGATSLNEAPLIAYGQLPSGWAQEIPKKDAPPPLIDGHLYHLGANLEEGRRVNMCFLIRDGKPQVYHGKYNGIGCDEE